MSQDSITGLQLNILKLADRCVKCGLCSAQCPTYLIDQSENESPRGRISLMHAVASNQLPITTQLIKPIEHCLSCYRCEKICPSGVKFGEMMANTRHLLNKTNPDFKEAWLIKWASNLTFAKWKILSKFIGTSFKFGLFRFFPRLKPIEEYVKPAIYRTNNHQQKNTVYLFTGCTSQILDTQPIHYAQQLLNLCNFSVEMPENQVCCGALPYHKGYLDVAAQCLEKNKKAFEHAETPILFLATACGAELKKAENSFSSRVTNITNFLHENKVLDALCFASLKKRVLIHTPCSEKNTSKESANVEKLLTCLPDIEILTLKESTSCCGAAGDYMLKQVDNANKIRQLLIKDIERIKPDIVITSNYTCGIHIANGLKEKNLDIAVMHPIELLFNQVIKQE